MRLIDADALYNGAMKEEYFEFKAHDEDGRESFAYSCAMQRLAEAPTIDAIPVEWLRTLQEKKGVGYSGWVAIDLIIQLWDREQKKQEV